MDIEIPALVKIGGEISDTLLRNVIGLVDMKFKVDVIARLHGTRFVEGLHDGGYGPKEGNDFFRTVLPFSDRTPVGKAFPALVPTWQTIGCSWKWWPSNLSESEILSYRAFFADPARAGEGANSAQYDWIQPLGLFLAGEGKNRVALMRELKEDWIPASVTPCSYPSADRITIYRYVSGREEHHWAVLDEKIAERLEYPSWALPVMQAYGVQILHSWPMTFPDHDTLVLAWREAQMHNNRATMDALDLTEILSRSERREEALKCSIVDVEDLHVDWRLHVGAILGALIMFVILLVLPESWTETRCALALVTGGLMTLGALPVMNIIHAPRKHLKHSWRL